MIIIWGTHVSQKSFGTTHHFCPVCRGICAGDLVHFIQMPHLYYIPIWRSVMPLLSCRSCRTTMRVPKKLRPMKPDADELRSRAQVEERMLANRLDWEQRKELIAEPFVALEYECVRLAREGGQQSTTSVLQVLAIVTVVGSFVTGYIYCTETRADSKAEMLPWFIGFLVATAACIGSAIYFAMRSHYGTARDLMTPRIARSLARMRPKREEIEEVLLELRRKGNKIAKAIDVDDIWDAMERRNLVP